MALSSMIRAPLHRESATPWKDRGALRVILAHACFQCFAPLLEVRLAQAIQTLPWAKLLQPSEIGFAQIGIVLATGLRLSPPISHEDLRYLPEHLVVVDNTDGCFFQKGRLQNVLNGLRGLGHAVIPLTSDQAVVVNAVVDCLAKLHAHCLRTSP